MKATLPCVSQLVPVKVDGQVHTYLELMFPPTLAQTPPFWQGELLQANTGNIEKIISDSYI